MRAKLQIQFFMAFIFLLMAPGVFAGDFRVVRVFDGDTFRAVGHDIEITVRLAGIDAPEGATRKRIKVQPFYNEATDFLSSLILNKVVEVRGHGTDRYNRVLAVVFIDDLNVNISLLQAGLAETYRAKPPENLDLTPFRHAENQAKQKRRGMWSLGANYISPSMWRKTGGRL